MSGQEAEGPMAPARPEALRPAGLGVAVLLALLLHALLLGGVPLGTAGPPAPPGPAPVQVRSVSWPAPPAPDPAPTTPAPAPVAAPAPQRPEPGAPVPARRLPAAPEPASAEAPEAAGPVAAAPEPAVTQPVAEAAPETDAGAEHDLPAAAPAEATAASGPLPMAPMALAAASAAPAQPPGGEPPPLYKVVLPPPLTLEYELRRGMLTGTGTLAWRPDGARYELQLDGTVLGLRVLTQASRGRLDARGLAPERFTDQRARRAMQAANFRRDVGRISFSGPTHELPLYPGVQDRLSWMVQLPGIVAADPARRAAGQRIVLQVVGARGDGAAWSVEVLGMEPVPTRAGAVPALHLRREPRGPYDTRVEVWLDPQRHYLPLRATQQSGDEEMFELRLR